MDYFTDMIVLDAGERLFQLKEKLRELKDAEYPSDGPLQLIQLLDLISDRLSEKLIRLSKGIAAKHIREEKERLITRAKRIAYTVSLIYRWLGAIELAQSKYNPQELVLPLEEIGRQIHHKSSLLICPIYEENYRYVEIINYLKQLVGQALEAEGEFFFAEYPEYFAVISFPSAAKDNVLQHVVFAHELGHLANDVHEISKSTSDAIELGEVIAQAVDGWFESEFSIELKEEERIRRISRLNDEIVSLITEWLGEMAADVYAVHLWNLASFFTNSQYLLTRQSLDTWTDVHPSPRFRLRVMLHEIREMGYYQLIKGPELEAVRRELNHWENLIEGDEQESTFKPENIYGWTISEAAYKLAKKVLEEVEQRARQEIHERVKQLESIRESGLQDMQDNIVLVKLLHHGIPPCEIRDGREQPYIGIAAILNAGWVHRITYPRDILGWKQADDIIKFFTGRIREEDRLVLRAIDLGEMYRLFSTRKERQ